MFIRDSRNDADCYGVDKDYIANYLKRFEQNPVIDALHGQLDFALEHYASHSLAYIGHRFFIALNKAARIRGENLCGGANSACRIAAYAKVGGYNPTLTIAEDVDFDRRINSSSKDTNVGYAETKSRLFSSGRSGAFAIKHGFAPIEQWSIEETTFGADEVDIRSCLLYTSPSPRDKRQSRMPSSA